MSSVALRTDVVLECMEPTGASCLETLRNRQLECCVPSSASSSCSASTSEGGDGPSDLSCEASTYSSEDCDDGIESDEAEGAATSTEVSQAAPAEPVAPAPTNSVVALVAATVFCGCACQAPYEVLNSRDKGCAPLLSLVEHIFGIVASLEALRQPRRLPWSLHLALAAVNAGYTLLLGAAFSTSLPMTVLVAMKNGNLVASMLLGIVVLRHKYALQQYAAVLILSCGLIVTSLSGLKSGGSTGSTTSGSDAGLGVIYLSGALLCRAASGMIQEVAGRNTGVTISELLLYRSALGLPLMLAQWSTIAKHATRWSVEPVISGLVWPTPWILLAAWIVADYGMKVCITRLIDRTSSLASALVLTLQRFVSFVISASALSQEPVTWDICLGVIIVLAGTVLYVTAQKAPGSQSKKTA